MTVAVIDALEMVDVDHQHRVTTPRALHAQELFAQTFVGIQAVGQSGERIMPGELYEFFIGPPQFVGSFQNLFLQHGIEDFQFPLACVPCVFGASFFDLSA